MNLVYTRELQKRKIYLKKKDPSLCPTDLHAAPQHSIKKQKTKTSAHHVLCCNTALSVLWH